MIQSSDRTQVNRALEIVYTSCYPLVRSLILSNTGSEANAADIFQESVIVFHRELRHGRYEGRSSLKGFLYGISRNLWLKELRKRLGSSVSLKDVPGSDLSEPESFSEFTLSHEEQPRIGDFVKQLDKPCQLLLEAFYYRKQSLRQIMELYGIDSESAVKNRKYRCMKKLIAIVKGKKLDRSSFKTD